jgi:hypothetical protein
MNTSFALARILGVLFVVMYGGLIINHKFIKTNAKKLPDFPLLPLITGFISLTIGLIILQLNNKWTYDFRLIVTLIGWLLVLLGSFRILLPKIVIRLIPKFLGTNSTLIVSIIFFLIGLYLSYVGFTDLL